MGISEVVMLAMVGHMVVFGKAVGMLMVPESWRLQVGWESKLVTYVARL